MGVAGLSPSAHSEHTCPHESVCCTEVSKATGRFLATLRVTRPADMPPGAPSHRDGSVGPSAGHGHFPSGPARPRPQAACLPQASRAQPTLVGGPDGWALAPAGDDTGQVPGTDVLRVGRWCGACLGGGGLGRRRQLWGFWYVSEQASAAPSQEVPGTWGLGADRAQELPRGWSGLVRSRTGGRGPGCERPPDLGPQGCPPSGPHDSSPITGGPSCLCSPGLGTVPRGGHVTAALAPSRGLQRWRMVPLSSRRRGQPCPHEHVLVNTCSTGLRAAQLSSEPLRAPPRGATRRAGRPGPPPRSLRGRDVGACPDQAVVGTCVDVGPRVPPAAPRAGALQPPRTAADAGLCFPAGRPHAQAALHGPALPGVRGEELRSLHGARGQVRQVSAGHVPSAAARAQPGRGVAQACEGGAQGSRATASPPGVMGDSGAPWEQGSE